MFNTYRKKEWSNSKVTEARLVNEINLISADITWPKKGLLSDG